ncbi:transcription antitermination factor NusB [Rubellicoccus peritrichatus]|uniref:Transcription antitermination protein NusB n=1 Tax=Rubellicoccus peritrichatus TaxID=3080537 RepID=A0AAQ3QSM3_9BACT|nr:transcription antitermination factor NusB [Puniceicoccus sp. CR14]WOO42653.1 transcription antitermination factor NusB [Puniceicoccus sp. CR14]
MSDEPTITESSVPEEPEEPAKPASKRRQNRVAAMQFLYMIEMNPSNDHKASVMTFFTNQDHPREYYAFAEELVWGALEGLDDVDETIRKHAKNWTFDRIAKVDLAILRLAIHELLHRRDIPPIVSINEAIDLSKEFSGPDSRRFVNGILDRLKENLDRPLRSAAD